MKEETMQIKLVTTRDTSIISVREKTAVRDVDALMAKAYDLLQQKGAKCEGTPFAIYHSAFFDPEVTDLEVGFPVSPFSNYTRVLSGSTCATCIHKGNYNSILETYAQILEWINSQGYTLSGVPYERYLNDPHKVPTEELLTEVYFPVEK